MEDAPGETGRPAAQYLRMSTDRQDVSLEFQARAIATWAKSHGFHIVQTFTDHGISGVTLEKRDALKELLRIVLDGHPGFSAILVYDVSRWGRFQNPDQAAHYEFMCQEAGVDVEYCAESFRNDGTAMSGLIKHVKRTMAAEFSRENSQRISRAKMVLRERNFWTGGQGGYGYRRAIVDADGSVIHVCDDGERFERPGCHTRLVLGPVHEVEIVRRIFTSYLNLGESYTTVARALNLEGLAFKDGGLWTVGRVRGVLNNPKYCGRLSLGRTRQRLGEPRQSVDPKHWVKSSACPPIVSTGLYDRVQAKIRWCSEQPSRADLIRELQRVAAECGTLSEKAIFEKSIYGLETFRDAFGGMLKAYKACGYIQTPKQAMYSDRIVAAQKNRPTEKFSIPELLDMLRVLWKRHGRLSMSLVNISPDLPHSSTYTRRFGSIATAYVAIGYTPSEQQLKVSKVRNGPGKRSRAFGRRRGMKNGVPRTGA
ncbi:recombinase family protein [Brevundimonas sp.]|uniref:recombinase family protein n=1 Tax=Brevundimonas sp. TaxID=1871086 RepID=UPI003D6D4343